MAAKRSTLQKTRKLSTMQLVVFALIFGAIGAGISWVALAAPGGKVSYSGTIALKLPPNKDHNNDGQLNYGDFVSFTISTNAPKPFVHLICTQNGISKAEGWRGYFEGSIDYPDNLAFGLYSGQWAGGAAECKGELAYQTGNRKNPFKVISSTLFHVNP